MPLTLITGPARSNADELLIERLALSAGSGRTTLLVPTTAEVDDWFDTLVKHDILGVNLATFDAWVRRMWLLHGDGRKVIGAAARATLVRKALEASPIETLERIGSSPGLPELLADIVKRLPYEPPDTIREPELREAVQVLRRYRRAIEDAGYVELAEATRLLAEDTAWFDGSLFVTQFSDFERVEEGLLVGLKGSGDVTIALAWQPDRAAYVGAQRLAERLGAAADHVVNAEPKTEAHPELIRFWEAIFEDDHRVSESDAVTFCEASCDDAEISLVARVVSELVAANGEETSVAVVFRDAQRRVAGLAAALESYGVEHSIDVRLPFSATGFGRALLCGLDACAGRDEGRGRLVAFLSSPFSGCDADWVARVEQRWRRRAASAADALTHAIREAPARTTTTLKLLQDLAREGVRSENVRKWQELAGMMLANDTHQGQSTATPADISAHKALLAAVNELAEIADGTTESELVVALRSVEVSTGGSGGHAVLVTEAHRLRGRRFDVVVVGGLTVDEFSPEPRESLAVTLLERLGVPKRVDERLQERTLFHTVITRATRALVLVRTSLDDRGEARRASAFWDAALDAYRSAAEAAEGIIPAELKIRRENLASLEDVAPSRLHGTRDVRHRASALAPRPPRRGVLADDRVLGYLEGKVEFSSSEVETYLSCPYRWFAEYVVRPRQIDTVFDARARGSLAHQLLATFYSRWQEMGSCRVTPDDLPTALELFDQVADECVTGLPAVEAGGLRSRVDAETAIRLAREAVIDDARLLPGYVPSAHEVKFGERVGAPVEFGGVKLSGSIDRIDTGPDGVVVTDYKTTGSVSGWKSFEKKGSLQVWLYAAVLRAMTGQTVVGAVYRSLSKHEIRGAWVQGAVELGRLGSERDGVTADELACAIEQAAETLRIAVDGMRSGRIAPIPRPESCRVCAAATWCEGARS